MLKRFLAALRRPLLFEEVDESFWREPYVSEQILDAHLDPSNDDASRRGITVSRSSRWIADLVEPKARLLDLGCGPGLYCESFYRWELQVTGLDYSTTSIDYAKKRAGELNHQIDYRLADYRSCELPGPNEIITLIYGGFCCITNAERDDLLRRVRAALVPGGLFVFDVFTSEYVERTPVSWYLKLKDGFWRPGLHLVVERKFEFPYADTHLDRYVVADIKHGVLTYNLWKHYYTQESLTKVLEDAGFEVVGWHGDLTGADFHPRGPWIGIVARRT
ncbi:MAG TPA: methyltransferase domain-containing protein [Spirochaetia bacterium]|nr:methyltransferase domain-containing protein [Spirochaetia bacterium]